MNQDSLHCQHVGVPKSNEICANRIKRMPLALLDFGGMDATSGGTTRQVDHVPDAKVLADFAQLRASRREEPTRCSGRKGLFPLVD